MGIDGYLNWLSVLILGGVIGFALWAAQASRHRYHPEQFAFQLLLVAVSVWFVAFAIMLTAADSASALFWARVGVIGISSVPAAAYSFSVAVYWNYSPAFRRGRYRATTSAAWAVSAAFILTGLFAPASLFNGIQLIDWSSYGVDLWAYYPRFGALGNMFLGFSVVMLVLTMLHFRAGYRAGGRWVRLRTRRLIAAFAIGSLALVDSLPSLNFVVPPVGMIPVAIALGMIVTTLRHYPLAHMVPPEPWNMVLDGLNEALLYVGEKGNIRSANKAAFEMFGLRKETLRDTLIKDIFPDYPTFGDPLALPAIVAGKKPYQIVYMPTPDSYHILDLKVAPLYERAGGPLNVVCFFEDVTAQVEAERALQESNHYLGNALRNLEENQQAAIDQERLRALGYVASGVVHELSNILTPIVSYSEILRSAPEIRNTPMGQESLDAVYQAAMDARKAVMRLRSFYKKENAPDQRQIVDVNETIREAIVFAQPKWKDMAQADGRTIDVRLELSDVAPIRGEPAGLREAFVNLIFNAVDALETGGTITLRSRMDEDGVLVEVKDTGVGMSDEVHRRALEPFFTTKAQNGTGLGLPLVYNTVTQARGTLRISTAPRAGTTVTMRFPAARDDVSDASQAQEGDPSKHLRILVVDDNSSVHEAVSQFLRLDGHSVDAEANPRVALERFRQVPYDLVLTDWSMPELSGNQLALAIKALSPRTPIILITGFGNTGLIPRQASAGIEAVLPKPFTRSELRAAIRQAVCPEPGHRPGDQNMRVVAGHSHRQIA